MPQPAQPIRTIVVDENLHERECMKRTLLAQKDFELIGEAEKGTDALELIRSTSPDLVFLGVLMDGMDGFDVLDSLREDERPEVVFVSTFEDYAVRAFEYRAIDYILKPCTPERFSLTMKKVKEVFDRRFMAPPGAGYGALSHEPDSGNSYQTRYLDRLVIKTKDRLYFIRMEDVDWIEAAADYVHVYALGKRHILRAKISELEKRLDPAHFVRIHRSTIVSIDRIAELRPMYHGDYQVVLADRTELTLSRGYRGRFSQFLINSI